MAFKPLEIGIKVHREELDGLIKSVQGLPDTFDTSFDQLENMLSEFMSESKTAMKAMEDNSSTAFSAINTQIKTTRQEAKKMFDDFKKGMPTVPGGGGGRPGGGGGKTGYPNVYRDMFGNMRIGPEQIFNEGRFNELSGLDNPLSVFGKGGSSIDINELLDFSGMENLDVVRNNLKDITSKFNVDMPTAFNKVNAVAKNNVAEFSRLSEIILKSGKQAFNSGKDFEKLIRDLQQTRSIRDKANARTNLAGGTGKFGAGLGVFASGINAFGGGGVLGRAAGTLSLGTALGGFGGIGGPQTAAILGLSVAIGGLQSTFGQAMGTAIELEDRLVRLRRASGELGHTVGDLKSRTHNLSRALGTINAQDVVHGVEELVKAGLTVDEAFGQAGKTVLMFSKVAEVSTGVATEFLVNTKNQLGIGFSTAADLIVAAADASTASIEEMSQAFVAGSFPAMSVGFSKEEFAALMAVVANMGLTGKEAATSLQRLGVRLGDLQTGLRVTAADMQVLQDIGLMEEFRKLQSMPIGEGLIDFLKAAVANAESVSQLSSLFDIFGQKTASRLKKAFEPGAKGASEFEEVLQKVKDAQGVNTLAFLDLQDTARSAFEEMNTGWDNFISALGQQDWLKDAARGMADLMATMTGSVRSGTRDINLLLGGIAGDFNPIMTTVMEGVAERLDTTLEKLIEATPLFEAQKRINNNDDVRFLKHTLTGVDPLNRNYGQIIRRDDRLLTELNNVLDIVMNSNDAVLVERTLGSDDFGGDFNAVLSEAVLSARLADNDEARQAIMDGFIDGIEALRDQLEGDEQKHLVELRDRLDDLKDLYKDMVNATEKVADNTESEVEIAEEQNRAMGLMGSRGIHQGAAQQFAGMSIGEIRNSDTSLVAMRNHARLLANQNLADKRGPGPDMFGNGYDAKGAIQQNVEIKIDAPITIELNGAATATDAEELAGDFVENLTNKIGSSFANQIIRHSPLSESVEV